MPRWSVLPAILAAALTVVPAAASDGGSPNYSSKLTSVAPKVKGLTLRVVDGDDAIELRNETGRNVTVPGYENEPYLRFLVDGRVEVNVNSPAKYLNEERYGGVGVPEGASADAKPRWELIAQGGSYTWHEHRIHWMSTGQPPRVKASGGGELQKVFDWTVPLRVGTKRVKAAGTLWWVPTGQLGRADALIAAAVAKEARQDEAAAKAAAEQEPAAETEASPTAVTQSAPAAVPDPAQVDSDSGSSLLWIVIGALGLALLVVAGYVVRLRRRVEPEGRAGEAW